MHICMPAHVFALQWWVRCGMDMDPFLYMEDRREKRLTPAWQLLLGDGAYKGGRDTPPLRPGLCLYLPGRMREFSSPLPSLSLLYLLPCCLPYGSLLGRCGNMPCCLPAAACLRARAHCCLLSMQHSTPFPPCLPDWREGHPTTRLVAGILQNPSSDPSPSSDIFRQDSWDRFPPQA